MTTHIDYAVTEVIPEADTSNEEQRVDPRFSEQEKITAILQQQQRLKLRTAAEGFDD